MKTIKEPRPGDIGFCVLPGFTGAIAGFLQYLVGDPNKYSHVFIVLDNGIIAEARRDGGVRLTPIAEYNGRAIYIDWGLNTDQRQAIVEHAKTFIGKQYSFLEYLVLAFYRFKMHPVWLLKKVQASGKYICSQYVATVYALAGIDMFDGKREPFSVTPGSILSRYVERDWL